MLLPSKAQQQRGTGTACCRHLLLLLLLFDNAGLRDGMCRDGGKWVSVGLACFDGEGGGERVG
jgi:hypothetical protein